MTTTTGETIDRRQPPFTHRSRVRWAACDMQGQVFNAHYFTWMDSAHWELWRSVVGSYSDLVDMGILFVLVEATARYRHGARLDDEVDIDVALDAMSTTSKSSRYTVRRGDTVLVEGHLRHVCVDAHTLDKTPWPSQVRNALRPHLQDE